MSQLNRIVTSPFFVEKEEKPQNIKYQFPLNFLIGYLIRASAFKVYVAAPSEKYYKATMEAIKKGSPSLAQNVEIVDKDGRILNRVAKYLRPVREEISGYDPNSLGGAVLGLQLSAKYIGAFDFLYKLVIATKLQAEADVPNSRFLFERINQLRESMFTDEARFRLDQLQGICNLYQKPKKIPTLRMLPHACEISVQERVARLLDDAEMIELMRNRHFLGIPSKIKLAVKRIHNSIDKILANRKYKNQICAAVDMVQTAVSPSGVRIPLSDVFEILRNLSASSFNPPIVDLNSFRFDVCRQLGTNGFDFLWYYIKRPRLPFMGRMFDTTGSSWHVADV
jgi:hypothetical protein